MLKIRKKYRKLFDFYIIYMSVQTSTKEVDKMIKKKRKWEIRKRRE